MAGTSSNLSRYCRIQFGRNSFIRNDFDNLISSNRTHLLGDEIKRKIILGAYILSHGFYDKYYLEASKVRRLIAEEIYKSFNSIDFLMLPTTANTAPKIGESIDPIQMYLTDQFTLPANLAGIPAISLPLSRDNNNVPFGFQLMANKFLMINFYHSQNT